MTTRCLTVSADVVVAATPEQVYALVSDPGQTPRWSPENTRARSTGSLAVGAHFDGVNRRGRKRWVTRSVVTAADPGERFAFRVVSIGLGRPVIKARNASWEYRMEPAGTGGGTRVIETWNDDRRWPHAIVRVFDRVATGTSFAEFQKGNLRTSLDRLKTVVESAG